MAVGGPVTKMFIDTSPFKKKDEDEEELLTTPEKNSIFDLNSSVDISHLDTPGTLSKKLKSILKRPLKEDESPHIKKDIKLMFTLPTKENIHYYNQDEVIEKESQDKENEEDDRFQFSNSTSPFQIRAKVEQQWTSLTNNKTVKHSIDKSETPLSPSTKSIFKKELEALKIEEYETKIADLAHQLEFHKTFSKQLDTRNKSMESALSLWVAYSNDKEQHLISTLKTSEMKINKLTNRVKKLRTENRELQKKMEEEVSLNNFSIGVQFDIARVAGINDTSYLCLNLNQSLEESVQSMASEEFERELSTRLHEYFALHQPVKTRKPFIEEVVIPKIDQLVLDSRTLDEYLMDDILYTPEQPMHLRRLTIQNQDDDKMKTSVQLLLSQLREHEEAYEAQRKAFDMQSFKDRETLKKLAKQLQTGDKDLSEILYQTKKAAETREENHRLALETMKERMAEATQNYEEALTRVEKLNLRVNLYKSMAENKPIDYGDAPQGEVALVFTDIQDSTKLWEHDETAMQNAVMIHNRVMREAILEFNGFEVKTEGDAFMMSFDSAMKAVECCSAVQLRLLEQDWPEGLVPEYFVPESVQEIRDDENNILFRGIRVRMGIHIGEPVCKIDNTTGRMDYFGPVVNRAARISGKAKGGQILVSDSVWSRVRDNLDTTGVGTLWSNRIGTTQLRGMEEKPEIIWSILPERLHKREHLKKRTAAGQRHLLEAERARYTSKVKELVTVKRTMGSKISSLKNEINGQKEEVTKWKGKSLRYQKQFLLTKTRLKKVEQQYQQLEKQHIQQVSTPKSVKGVQSPKSISSPKSMTPKSNNPSPSASAKYDLTIDTNFSKGSASLSKTDSMTPMSMKSNHTSKSVKTAKSSKSVKGKRKRRKSKKKRNSIASKKLTPRVKKQLNEYKELKKEIKVLNNRISELDELKTDTNSLATGDDFIEGYDTSAFKKQEMCFFENPTNESEIIMNKIIQKPVNVVRLKEMIQQYSESNLFAYQLKQQSKKDRAKIEALMKQQDDVKDKDSFDILDAINSTATTQKIDQKPKKRVSTTSENDILKRFCVIFKGENPILVLDAKDPVPEEFQDKPDIHHHWFQMLDNNLIYLPDLTGENGNPRIVPTPETIKTMQVKYHKMVLKHHLEQRMGNVQSLDDVVQSIENQYVKPYEEDDSGSEYSFEFIDDNRNGFVSYPPSNVTSACTSPKSITEMSPNKMDSPKKLDSPKKMDSLKNQDKIQQLSKIIGSFSPEDLGETEQLNPEDKLTAFLTTPPVRHIQSKEEFEQSVNSTKSRINHIIDEDIRQQIVQKLATPQYVDASIQTLTLGKINISDEELSPKTPIDTIPVPSTSHSGESGHYLRVIDELRGHNSQLLTEKQDLVKEVQIYSSRCQSLNKRIDSILKSQSLREEKSLRTTKELFNLSQSDVRELKKIEKQIARQKFNAEYLKVQENMKTRLRSQVEDINYKTRFNNHDKHISTVPKLEYINNAPSSPEMPEFIPIVERPKFTRSVIARSPLNNTNVHRLPRKKPTTLTSPHIQRQLVPTGKSPNSLGFNHYLQPLPDCKLNSLPALSPSQISFTNQ